MLIKRDSGLSKFYDDLMMDRPSNVCWLFWKTIFAMSNVVFIITAFTALAATILIGGISVLHFGFSPMGDTWVALCQILFFMLAFIGGVFAAFVGIKKLGLSVIRYAPKDNLAVEFLKAKKGKICPLVEWE